MGIEHEVIGQENHRVQSTELQQVVDGLNEIQENLKQLTKTAGEILELPVTGESKAGQKI